jgi:hypothetical protein
MAHRRAIWRHRQLVTGAAFVAHALYHLEQPIAQLTGWTTFDGFAVREQRTRADAEVYVERLREPIRTLAMPAFPPSHLRAEEVARGTAGARRHVEDATSHYYILATDFVDFSPQPVRARIVISPHENHPMDHSNGPLKVALHVLERATTPGN